MLPPRKGAVLKVKERSTGQTEEKGDSCDTDKITDNASKSEDVDKELTVDKSDNETDRQPQEVDGDLSASGRQIDKLDSSASKLEDGDKELTVDKSDNETDRQPQEVDGDLSANGQQTDKLDSGVTSKQSDITDKDLNINDKDGSDMNLR